MIILSENVKPQFFGERCGFLEINHSRAMKWPPRAITQLDFLARVALVNQRTYFFLFPPRMSSCPLHSVEDRPLPVASGGNVCLRRARGGGALMMQLETF